jgi:hydroxymethylbilane synthase
MQSVIKIGTRESELAVWQANMVKEMLEGFGHAAELVYIKSEGDIDLKTPLYEMGVQGIFTRSLDIALLNNSIDIAVHSMKDVPTQLPEGIVQAAVIKRGNFKDLFVINGSAQQWVNEAMREFSADPVIQNIDGSTIKFSELLLSYFKDFIQSLDVPSIPIFTYAPIDPFSHTPIQPYTHTLIASSSIRRKAQWLHRYPNSSIENIRGNVNTRLQKVVDSSWKGAIFAAAGLERINKRPANAIELDWMLPAPAQGAVMVVAKKENEQILSACAKLNDDETALCTKVERDFLRHLLGGCSTPIGALAQVHNREIHFEGNILSLDGKEKVAVQQTIHVEDAGGFGKKMAIELLNNGGAAIAESIRNGK